jgi:hypothetical protein
MRKLKGAHPGKLFQLKFGSNSFGKTVFPFHRYTSPQMTPEENKLVVVYRTNDDSSKSYTRKTSILEYFPEGTYGIILLAKRTRATQGAVPYVIAMIGGEVFKISADCISFVE